MIDTHHHQLLDTLEHILASILNVRKYIYISRSILQQSIKHFISHNTTKLDTKLTVSFLYNLFGYINVHDIKTAIDRNMVFDIALSNVN